MFFVRDKVAKELLKTSLIVRAIPKLQSLGFGSPVKLVKGYSSLWLRDRDNQIDLFDFQWDWHGRPAFQIHFRDITHPDDLRVIREFPGKATPWDFGLSASMAKGKWRWFAPSLAMRLAPFIDKEVARVVTSACNRISEISTFLEGGQSSGYFCDNIFWNDKRLPTNPPPWTDNAPGSAYHLPLFRVGTCENPWGRSL